MIKKAVIVLSVIVLSGTFIIAFRTRANNSGIKLVLVISVDQYRSDYFTRFADVYQGGFKLLRERAAYFNKAYYRHSATETGPGHSVILTGRHGAHSGIVANGWYDRYLKKTINVVDDPANTAVGGNGRGASPANLIGFSVGDMLKKKSPASKVISIALKDRSAVLLGGHRADAVYWYDPDAGNFVSSTFYMNDLPDFIKNWNSKEIPDSMFGKKWERLLPNPSLYEKLAGPDAVEGEYDRKETAFPHIPRGAPGEEDYYDDLRRFPEADAWTLEIVLEAIKHYQLGADDAPDLLAVGFSATDIIGHTYGPDSQELMDQLLRLDRLLGTLFSKIDESIGLDHTILALTADHGLLPLVENLQARGIQARRIQPSVLKDQVINTLKQKFPGAENLIAYYDQPHFYLNESAITQAGIKIDDVIQTVAKTVKDSGFVITVYTPSDFAVKPPENDPYFKYYKNSYFAPRSPHVIGVLKEYFYMEPYPGGTGHGSVHEYDRHVPVIFMGPGIRSGTYSQEAGPEDLAPTLARMLKIEFQKEDDARILHEILSGE